MALNVRDFGSHAELVVFANGKAAGGLLTMPDPKDLTDEQALTVDDGTNPATVFRIDADGGGVGGGATPIDISGIANGDKDALATAVAGAVNGVAGGLAMVATAGGDKVGLVNGAGGAAGNVALTQGVGGSGLEALPIKFGIEGMSGGSEVIAFANIVAIREHHERWYLFWDA